MNAPYIFRATEHSRAIASQGYVILPRALNPREVEAYLDMAETISRHGIESDVTFPIFRVHNLVQNHVAFRGLLSHPQTLRIVYDVLGPYLRAISSELWVRRVGAPGEKWHHDGYPAMPHIAPILQMKVQFFLTSVEKPFSGNLLVSSSYFGAGDADGEADPIVIKARPGDAIVWAGNLRHAVAPNQASHDRLSIILGYSYLWTVPYDFDEMSDDFAQVASPLERLLVSGVAAPRRRGAFYKPKDEQYRLELLAAL